MRFLRTAFVSILMLIQLQVAVCSYSFSIRIASAQCCDSPGCEQVGECEDLFVFVCVRQPNTTKMNRQTCSFFIAGNGSDIINRDLTPADVITINLESAGLTRINNPYQGGFQVYIGVLTRPDIPPFSPPDVIVDEVFIEVQSAAGGSEAQSLSTTGERGLVMISLSLSVDCTPGFGGDDCVTVNTCNEGIICNNQTGYCNSEGECICHEGFTQSETGCVEGGDESDDGSDILPIAVGAGLGGILLLLFLLILLVVVILICRRRRYKSRDMYMLTASPDFNSTPTSPPTVPLYSQVNKDKKKRNREDIDVPPAIPPYRSNLMRYDSLAPASNGDRVPDVAYATTIQREGTGYRNVVLESSDIQTEETEEDQPRGLVYADLEHDQITSTTFQTPSSPDGIKYSDVTQKPPHEYENVLGSGRAQEVMYYEVK